MENEHQVSASLIEIASSLEDEALVSSEWEKTMAVTPDVIVIIGEAMIMASVPSTATIKFTEDNLKFVFVSYVWMRSHH
jgi:hypothetical protein